MYRSFVYEGDEFLGEVEIYPQQQRQIQEEFKEIRVTRFSQPSERCPPLAVLHTITSTGVCFKMEAYKTTTATNNNNNSNLNSPLFLLHSSCIRENKTAIMSLNGEELHLVAMYSRSDERQYPCFWAFKVLSGLYSSCLVMLNLRCLGIVFDLDETLVVANTMRSFEDKIEALQRKISAETDTQRISGMLAEVKRYQEDKMILKQYAEHDQVVENGKVIKTQPEIVPALSENHQPLVRPLIRLQEKNVILTRINPQIRDTSVLVKLRPAWEDLRSYLTARGRKRFEVYVCTMAERDYALEMWRLLDPEANLINTKELLDRIVCVKSGFKKSLFNVFHNGMCHPKMALVIDDRWKVWDEKDQPRVHVVPAFAPYYAPQAEANNSVPVLCVARNVACNVRGGFFKEFDDGLLQKISEIAYEDDIKDVPSSPDVSNYLVSEDDAATTNGTKDPLSFDGMADLEVERRLKEAAPSLGGPSTVTNVDPVLTSPAQFPMASSTSPVPLSAPQASVMQFPHIQYPPAVPQVRPLSHVVPPEPSLQSSPAREEGEVPESELDPDTRRRLLILQHGQDTREHAPSEPSLPVRPPLQVSVPRVPSRGSWFPVEEEMSPRQLNRSVPKEFPSNSEPRPIEKDRSRYPPFYQKMETPVPPDRIIHENQRLSKEVLYRDDRLRMNHPLSSYHNFPGEGMALGRSVSNSRDFHFDSRRGGQNLETSAAALHDIAAKCGARVEFRPGLVNSIELQFSDEVWFAGEKIGDGIGRTRREARDKACESSLKNLANIYLSRGKPDSYANNDGFPSNLNSSGRLSSPREEFAAFSVSPETSRPIDPRLEGSSRPMGPVAALKELCMMEGLGVVFQPSPSANVAPKDEVHAQVEVDGQVLGKGIGLTWDEATMQAAERALGNLRSMPGQFPQKRQGSPRFMQGMSSKRLKPDFLRASPRLPSNRYPRNASPVP